MATEMTTPPVNMVTLIQHAMDDWRRGYDPASDDGPTMAEAIADAISGSWAVFQKKPCRTCGGTRFVADLGCWDCTDGYEYEGPI